MSTFINKLFNTPLLQNKFVLYASLFVVLIALVRNISNGNMNAVILMALVGLLTSYFSKNMIIILLTAFFTVFLLQMLGSQGVMEGMETKKETEKEKEKEGKGKEKEKEKEKEKKSSNDKPSTEKNSEDTSSKAETTDSGNKALSSKNEPKKKTKQGMTSLSPASYDGEDHDIGEGENAHSTKEANRIDYASTLEEAYDNIENIIGEDGVRGLTDQTKSLMNQQKELMNNMKEMGPLLKSAESFMGQLTGNGGIKGITDMLKGFATPGGGKK